MFRLLFCEFYLHLLICGLLSATAYNVKGAPSHAMEPPFWSYSSLGGLLLAFALVGYCLHEFLYLFRIAYEVILY